MVPPRQKIFPFPRKGAPLSSERCRQRHKPPFPSKSPPPCAGFIFTLLEFLDFVLRPYLHALNDISAPSKSSAFWLHRILEPTHCQKSSRGSLIAIPTLIKRLSRFRTYLLLTRMTQKKRLPKFPPEDIPFFFSSVVLRGALTSSFVAYPATWGVPLRHN